MIVKIHCFNNLHLATTIIIDWISFINVILAISIHPGKLMSKHEFSNNKYNYISLIGFNVNLSKVDSKLQAINSNTSWTRRHGNSSGHITKKTWSFNTLMYHRLKVIYNRFRRYWFNKPNGGSSVCILWNINCFKGRHDSLAAKQSVKLMYVPFLFRQNYWIRYNKPFHIAYILAAMFCQQILMMANANIEAVILLHLVMCLLLALV
jgi:hypothetical protein